MVERLIPRDALEFSFAPFANAQHRVEQTLGRIQPRAIRATAQACPQLRFGHGVLAEFATGLVTAIIGRKSNNDIALLVRHQHVTRAAIVVA
jgi:hypothetical protein